MIQDRIKSQRNACLSKIERSSSIDDADKMLFRDLVNNAADGTNGLSQEQKLQNVSETVFSLVMLKIMDKCSEVRESKISTMYSTISDCKWAICVLGGIIALMCVLRPELSALLISLSN